MKPLKEIISNKKTLVIIGVVVIIIIVVIIFGLQPRGCNQTGTPAEKTYKTQIMPVDEWKKYTDPEAAFFFQEDAQKFISEKINALKGYGGLSYLRTDSSLSVDRSYSGTICQSLRYKYEIVVNASISGTDLSAALFGRWYYKDLYKITATYNPAVSKWESFDINLAEPKLLPGSAIDLALVNAKKGSNFQEIKKQGYEIADVYWEPKNKNAANDIVVLVYSKVVEGEDNCFNYYTIKIDNFANLVVSENQEKKCQK